MNARVKQCLNLGCGSDIRRSTNSCKWVNVDNFEIAGVDKVVDLNKHPYSFKDESFDSVICYGVLEYLDDVIKSVSEIHRILKPGGKAIVQVPYSNGPFGTLDVLNKHFFSYNSFKEFEKRKNPHHNINFKNLGFAFSSVNVKFVFGKKFCIWNYLIEPLANLFPSVYEFTPLRIFPALHLRIEMRK